MANRVRSEAKERLWREQVTERMKTMTASDEIRQKITQMVEVLKPFLSSEVIAETVHFIEHGEYGIAFEDLCVFLENTQQIISDEAFHHIEDVGSLMSFDPQTWKLICHIPYVNQTE